MCRLELVGECGKYLNYACLRYRPVKIFLPLEPVVTALIYHVFIGFGNYRSELSVTITGTYRYNIYHFGSDRLHIYPLLYKTGVDRLY